MREPNSELRGGERKPPEAYRRTIIEIEDEKNVKLIRDPSDNISKSFQLTYHTPFRGDVEQLFENGRQAVLYTSLLLILGDFHRREVGDYGIPVEVALDGRPAIAAYLHAVWREPAREIAGRMCVDVETVWDYWSQVRQRARDEADIVKWEL